MMTPQQLEEALANLTQLVAALRAENEALRGPYEALGRDYTALQTQYLALAQTINGVVAERDALKLKVAELEAVNKKLTDMLWGRRSERRVDVSISPLLDFGDDLQGPLQASDDALGPAVIVAGAAAQAAYDAAKLAELERAASSQLPDEGCLTRTLTFRWSFGHKTGR